MIDGEKMEIEKVFDMGNNMLGQHIKRTILIVIVACIIFIQCLVFIKFYDYKMDNVNSYDALNKLYSFQEEINNLSVKMKSLKNCNENNITNLENDSNLLIEKVNTTIIDLNKICCNQEADIKNIQNELNNILDTYSNYLLRVKSLIDNHEIINEYENNVYELTLTNNINKINISISKIQNQIYSSIDYINRFDNSTYISIIFLFTITIISVIIIIWYFKNVEINYKYGINNNGKFINTLINNSENVIIAYNFSEGKSLYVSENITKILGVNFNDVYKNPFILENYFEEKLFDSIDQDVFFENNQKPSYYDCVFNNPKNNEKMYLGVKLYFIKEEKNKIKIILYITDNTKIKKTQELLKNTLEEEKLIFNNQKDLISKTTHEIRTPLNGILGMANIASISLEDNNKLKSCINKITDTSNLLLSIVNNILDMSKLENGKLPLDFNKFNIYDLINSILFLFDNKIKEKKLNFNVQYIGVVTFELYGDDLKLKQVLINLLNNAIKFTPENESINFSIIQRSIEKERSNFEFIVEDTGIGMSEEFLKNLFTPFHQENKVREKGTGLGLCITHELVDLMGGSIRVRSEIDVGTTFNVIIPFEINSIDHQEYFKNYDLNILVIDKLDDYTVIKNIFQHLYINSKHASNINEAIDMMKKEKFDMCFINWMLDDCLGLVSLERIKQVDTLLPIIITSDFIIPISKNDYDLYNIHNITIKPFSTIKIFKTIQNYFEPIDLNNQKSEFIDFSNKNILIVDDDIINCEITSEFLKIKNANVKISHSAEEAIKIIDNSKLDYFDIILMDFRLPGINGFEAITAIRKLKRIDVEKFKIVVMTANTLDEIKEDLNEDLINGFINKPININQLYNIINKI